MITCKLCGTSNEAKSSVCKKCGVPLRERTKQSIKNSSKEIYSSRKPQDSFIDLDDNKDVFSSRKKYEIARKEKVLGKIYERELELGDAPLTPYTFEENTAKNENETVETVQPLVINRINTSDIVGAKNTFVPRDTGYGTVEHRKAGNNTNKNNNKKKKQNNKQNNKNDSVVSIPQRELKPVDTQKIAAQQQARERRAEAAFAARNNIRRQDNTVKNNESSSTAKQSSDDVTEQKTKVIELEKTKKASSQNDDVKTFERKPKKPVRQNTGVKVSERPVNNSISSDLEDKKRSVKPVEKKKTTGERLNDSEKAAPAILKKDDSLKKRYDVTPDKTITSEAEQELLYAVKITLTENDSEKEKKEKITVQEKKAVISKSAETAENEAEVEPINTVNTKEKSAAENTAEKPRVKPVKTVKTEDKPTAENTAEKPRLKPVKTVKTEDKPAAENTAEKRRLKPVTTVKTEDKPAAESTSEKPRVKPVKTVKTEDKPAAENTAEETKTAPIKTAKTEKKADTEKSGETADTETKARSGKTANSANSAKTKKKVFSDEDIAANKYYASCAYFGVLLLLPFLKRKESKFCRAHTKQGTAVFVYSLIVELISLLLVIGLRALLVWVLGMPYAVYSVLMIVVFSAMCVLLVIPAFSGAKNAFSGKYKSVPIAGKFVKKKSTGKKKSSQKKAKSPKEKE